MKHHVLCIDDETHNLEALERLLRKNFQVTTASSGKEAVEKLKVQEFSLIISDQKMPEMTGVEFFVHARKDQPNAIRILLTGYTDLESVIGAINQGQIYRYITKPWEPEEFLGVVNQAIELFEMRQTIVEQNELLTKANEDLKSLDKLKTDFMLLVNHELKTPLTGIFSFVQLLAEENLSAEQKLYVEKIKNNTTRLQELINDTLLITKIKATSENLAKEETDIRTLIEGLWQSVGQNFKNKGLSLSIHSDSPFVQAINEKYVSIILKKLIHNCYAHAKADTQVDVFLKHTESGWEVECKNQTSQTIGKSAEQLLSAFSTNKEILNHSGGSGLGLAVIQAILNLFDGKIAIELEDDRFCIKIHLPNG